MIKFELPTLAERERERERERGSGADRERQREWNVKQSDERRCGTLRG